VTFIRKRRARRRGARDRPTRRPRRAVAGRRRAWPDEVATASVERSPGAARGGREGGPREAPPRREEVGRAAPHRLCEEGDEGGGSSTGRERPALPDPRPGLVAAHELEAFAAPRGVEHRSGGFSSRSPPGSVRAPQPSRRPPPRLLQCGAWRRYLRSRAARPFLKGRGLRPARGAREEVHRSVKTGKPLRVKVGFDPSAPDSTSATLVFRKCGHFQDWARGRLPDRRLHRDDRRSVGRRPRPAAHARGRLRNAETYQAAGLQDPDREKTVVTSTRGGSRRSARRG